MWTIMMTRAMTISIVARLNKTTFKNTLIMKIRVVKMSRMRIMMITSSMVKAVILNTLAISREVAGEARSNPTCRSPPSPPATSLGAIVEENLKKHEKYLCEKTCIENLESIGQACLKVLVQQLYLPPTSIITLLKKHL